MTTATSAFATTVTKSEAWIDEMLREMEWSDRHRALRGLRASLHALRDRLEVHEAVHLGAQLPMLIRGLYYENWTPARTPVRARSKEDYLQLVARGLQPGESADAERIVAAVFRILERHVSAGEIDDVIRALPDPVAGLWPA